VSVKLLDLEVSTTKRLRELPYPAYLCAIYVMAGEIRRAYLDLLSEKAKLLSTDTLDTVRQALCNTPGRVGSDNGLYRRWEQLNDDPAEDGPSGWFAAMFTFKALAGEVTGKTRLRTTATYITDAAGQLPAAGAAGQPGGGVEDPVAQRFRLGPGQVAVEGDELEPGDQVRGDQRGGEPCLVQRQEWLGSLPMPQSFPVRMLLPASSACRMTLR
jgi:hypothetical protein